MHPHRLKPKTPIEKKTTKKKLPDKGEIHDCLNGCRDWIPCSSATVDHIAGQRDSEGCDFGCEIYPDRADFYDAILDRVFGPCWGTYDPRSDFWPSWRNRKNYFPLYFYHFVLKPTTTKTVYYFGLTKINLPAMLDRCVD